MQLPFLRKNVEAKSKLPIEKLPALPGFRRLNATNGRIGLGEYKRVLEAAKKAKIGKPRSFIAEGKVDAIGARTGSERGHQGMDLFAIHTIGDHGAISTMQQHDANVALDPANGFLKPGEVPAGYLINISSRSGEPDGTFVRIKTDHPEADQHRHAAVTLHHELIRRGYPLDEIIDRVDEIIREKNLPFQTKSVRT